MWQTGGHTVPGTVICDLCRKTHMKAQPSGWQVFALGHPWVLPPSQDIWPSPQETGVGVLQSENC